MSEMFIITNGTIATISLISSMSIVGSPLLILSAVCSGISTLGSALKKASNITEKYESHKQTYLNYEIIFNKRTNRRK